MNLRAIWFVKLTWIVRKREVSRIPTEVSTREVECMSVP